MADIRQKVTCYITRQQGDRLQLLVFDHMDFPEAGTQVPGGSIDPGESPEQAALREALEESGLEGLRVVRYVGVFPWYWAETGQHHNRHVFHLTADRPLPDHWVHVVSDGDEDKGLRFAYHWSDVDGAAPKLYGVSGLYLGWLNR